MVNAKGKNIDAENAVADLADFAAKNKLNVSELAEQLSVPRSTVAKWFNKKKSGTLPSKSNLEKISSFLAKSDGGRTGNERRVVAEARERAEKIMHLLILLESELGWFRDGDDSARQIFRDKLDPYDIGYIASLMMMLDNEDKFQRWLALTTNRFQYFRGGK